MTITVLYLPRGISRNFIWITVPKSSRKTRTNYLLEKCSHNGLFFSEVLSANGDVFSLLCSCPLAPITKVTKVLSGPKYDGKYLHKIVREKLGGIKLHQTLTNVVIPTFDIKILQPVIFSSYKVIHFLFQTSNGAFIFHYFCGFVTFCRFSSGEGEAKYRCPALRYLHLNLSSTYLPSCSLF